MVSPGYSKVSDPERGLVALTLHRLLQELSNLLDIFGVQGGGEDKLALCLHEVLPEQLPASRQGLASQGLRRQNGQYRGNKKTKKAQTLTVYTGATHNMWLQKAEEEGAAASRTVRTLTAGGGIREKQSPLVCSTQDFLMGSHHPARMNSLRSYNLVFIYY